MAFLFLDFLGSLVIEFPIFWFFLTRLNKSAKFSPSKILMPISILSANIGSYIVIAIYVFSTSIFFPADISDSPSFGFQPRVERGLRVSLGAYQRAQQAFHIEHKYFASSFDDLDISPFSSHLGRYKYPSNFIRQTSPSRIETGYYTINLSGDTNKSLITATARIKPYNSMTYIIIFARETENYFSGICRAENYADLAPSAQIINGELQCSPGSQLIR